jgi:hypothetical protein
MLFCGLRIRLDVLEWLEQNAGCKNPERSRIKAESN